MMASVAFGYPPINSYNVGTLYWGEEDMGAKGTTKNSGRKDEHDRFYTTRAEAARLMSEMKKLVPSFFDGNTLFVEPSAGAGSFVIACEDMSLPVLAYDLIPSDAPVCATPIKTQDFLALDKAVLANDAAVAGSPREKMVFIGNPPFGVQGDLSVSFVNHCFELGADEVWFILPPTFRKESYLAKMPHAEIARIVELSTTSYELPDGAMRDVPSVFICFSYIEKKPDPIPTSSYLEKLPFEFCKKKDAEFTVRRVGGTSGEARMDTSLSEQSNYFCKMKDGQNMKATEAVEKICALDFPERDWTVGPRSVSKRELARRWCDVYEKDK